MKVKFLFLTLCFSFYNLHSMESGEHLNSQIIFGLADDVSKIVIQYVLGKQKIKKLLNRRAKLLSLSKTFLQNKEFIDKQAIESLKKSDQRKLNLIFNQLMQNANIQKRLSLFPLFCNLGFKVNQLNGWYSSQKANYECVVEAVTTNDLRWIKLLMETKNFTINYSQNSTSVTDQPLTIALKLVDEHPEGCLNVIELLLKEGADPFKIPLDQNHKYKTIFELYTPQKTRALIHPFGKFNSPQAEKINKILNQYVQARPKELQQSIIDSQKAKEVYR